MKPSDDRSGERASLRLRSSTDALAMASQSIPLKLDYRVDTVDAGLSCTRTNGSCTESVDVPVLRKLTRPSDESGCHPLRRVGRSTLRQGSVFIEHIIDLKIEPLVIDIAEYVDERWQALPLLTTR